MKPWRNVFSLVPDVHARLGYYQFLWQRHFYDGLAGVVSRLLIPQGIDFDWIQRDRHADPATVAHHRAEASNRLWEQIQAAHRQPGLDAVITYCFGSDLEPGLVQQTIQLGVPWINFFCDSIHRFEEIEALARVVSLNWFTEHAAVRKYQALGVPFARLPYAVNPECLPDLGCRSPRYPVGFVGLPSHNRITQLGWLRLRGCRVEIRGRGWVEPQADPFYSPRPLIHRLGKALRRPHFAEKIVRRLFWPLVQQQASGELDEAGFRSFIAACQVMLGLNQAQDERGRLSSYLKFRDIEFPGYGCCCLTEQNEDISEAFDVGSEVLTYRSIGGAAREIRRLTQDQPRAMLIGQAGRRRVLADHTWAARLAELAARL
jgi:hypothetical protein